MTRILAIALLAAAVGTAGCVSKAQLREEQEARQREADRAEQLEREKHMVVVELEQKAAALMNASENLSALQGNVDELNRRLAVICADYPDHQACAEQMAAKFALEAFCSDPEFTNHVDSVVSACHQGQCKQVDDAALLTRAQYMTLVQRLPHKLVLFRLMETKLDKADKAEIQKFITQIGADRGYVIIVGRASKDGRWKVNLRLAVDRAETTRRFIVEDLGLQQERVGYITYGHPKMYLTETDAENLTHEKLSETQANRSAFIFAYPCFKQGAKSAETP